MTRDGLGDAIVRPAGTVAFESGLVDTLLDDVTNKPGGLPLLQFALREMWGRLDSRCITRASYDAIGGVEGALAQQAQAIYDALTSKGQDEPAALLFRRLFTRLVILGEGAEDTRRVVGCDELGREAWALAQRLAGEDNRLVVAFGAREMPRASGARFAAGQTWTSYANDLRGGSSGSRQGCAQSQKQSVRRSRRGASQLGVPRLADRDRQARRRGPAGLFGEGAEQAGRWLAHAEDRRADALGLGRRASRRPNAGRLISRGPKRDLRIPTSLAAAQVARGPCC